jgi:hypothetical protein
MGEGRETERERERETDRQTDRQTEREGSVKREGEANNCLSKDKREKNFRV